MLASCWVFLYPSNTQLRRGADLVTGLHLFYFSPKRKDKMPKVATSEKLPVLCLCKRCVFIRAAKELKNEMSKEMAKAVQDPVDYGFAYFGLGLIAELGSVISNTETLICDINNPKWNPESNELPF